jgi:hypothetical protein
VNAVTDDDLIEELRSLFAAAEPLEPLLVEQARLAYSWRTVDAELAELSYDSLMDSGVLAGVRDGGTGPRLLGFGAVVDGEELAIEVEVTGSGTRSALVGQLIPPLPARVHVQSSTGREHVAQADDLGSFRIEPVPPGPVRLRVEHGGRTVQTTWVSYLRHTG